MKGTIAGIAEAVLHLTAQGLVRRRRCNERKNLTHCQLLLH
jgi:hypothetical protein